MKPIILTIKAEVEIPPEWTPYDRMAEADRMVKEVKRMLKTIKGWRLVGVKGEIE